MTRYWVQISRWYEFEADDDDSAVIHAGEMDDDEELRPEPTINVTNLDEAERAGRPIDVEPGMCPYPIKGKLTARECIEAGQCGCANRNADPIAVIERLGFGDQPSPTHNEEST